MDVEQELQKAIQSMKDWDSLTFIQKLQRKKPKPSGYEHRIVNIWLETEVKDTLTKFGGQN